MQNYRELKVGLQYFQEKHLQPECMKVVHEQKEIAAYIGDLESTTQKYYIAIRKKVVSNGEVRQVVKLPGIKEETTVA